MSIQALEIAIDTRAAERWLSLRRARRWGARGFWAVTDQGLFSLSNFLLNILLARWLSPGEYGAFTVGFSILLVAGALHAALITDPMLVFGAGRFADAPASYLRALILGHWALTIPLAVVALAVGLGLYISDAKTLAPVLSSLALAAPVYLLLMLLRRGFQLRLEPRESALGSGVFLAFSLLGAFVLLHAGMLSSGSAFLALAAGSLASSAWLLHRLRAVWSNPRPADISEVASMHWRFGRWAIGANFAVWVRGNLFYLILPLWGGLESSAAFRALANLVLPFILALVSLGPLLLPALAKTRARPELAARAGRIGLALALGGIAYWLVLGCLGAPIVGWLYAGRYVEHANLAWVIGLIPIFCAVGFVAAMVLRSLERPDGDFWANAAAALTALTVGVLLARSWGVAGGVAGWALSEFVAMVLMLTTSASMRREAKPG